MMLSTPSTRTLRNAGVIGVIEAELRRLQGPAAILDGHTEHVARTCSSRDRLDRSSLCGYGSLKRQHGPLESSHRPYRSCLERAGRHDLEEPQFIRIANVRHSPLST